MHATLGMHVDAGFQARRGLGPRGDDEATHRPADHTPPWMRRERVAHLCDVRLVEDRSQRVALRRSVTKRLLAARRASPLRPAGHAWACPCGPCEAYWDRQSAHQDEILAKAVRL